MNSIVRRAVDRRSLLIGAGATAFAAPLLALGVPPCMADPSHPAASYLKKVAADLMAAQRSGSPADFFQAINRHADVPSIANYALGRYRLELSQAERPKFYRGVAAFMARYFADQSRSYRIVRADFGAVRKDENGEVLVGSTITLSSGSTYNVTWRLVPSGGAFKVRDVSVLGFSLSHLQRTLFHAYMARRGGLRALVAALTR